MSWQDDYEPVDVRIERFWMDHPEGRQQTFLHENTPRMVVMEARLWRKMDPLEQPWATGFAAEDPAALEKPIEVCETSAIGRALANAGYAKTGKRMSAEEAKSFEAAKARAARPKVQTPPKPQIQRETRTEPPAEDPWTSPADPFARPEEVQAAVDTVTAAMPGSEVIEDRERCEHGVMTYREGTIKTGERIGDPYYAWFCNAPSKRDQCRPTFLKEPIRPAPGGAA